MARNSQASREFSRRIQSILIDRGWNQSELARRSAKFMPDGSFGRDNISKYVKGPTLPTPLHLNAMAKALGVEPELLLPGRLLATDMEADAPLQLKQEGNMAWLRVNQRVPMEVALKVAALLGGGK